MAADTEDTEKIIFDLLSQHDREHVGVGRAWSFLSPYGLTYLRQLDPTFDPNVVVTTQHGVGINSD